MTDTPDLPTLAAIHAASFVNPRPWSAPELRALLDGSGTFLLAEPGGFLIGRAIADEAELLTLAVAPDRRRGGIGARLVAAFTAEAQARGAATAFLEVAADNTAALALYRRHGFAETGRRPRYYTDGPGAPVDALVLCRALPANSPKT